MAADLPAEPFNREEEYLADIAGQNVEVPPCPWSRKEAYLAEIGGRLDDMDDRIAALATDLSFKGSVATESDLPAGAAVGDTYITEDTGVMYVWTGTDWTALGGTGITVADEPGTSTTDAMSQYAATALVYRMNSATSFSDHAIKIGGQASAGGNDSVAIGYKAKNSSNYTVAIGESAEARGTGQVSVGYQAGVGVSANGSVAIGRSAKLASGINHAIALGDFSKANYTGEMNIGTPESAGNGYNNTDYRLLTGVHDPVNAHDAATKGYVDTAVSGGGVTVLTSADTSTYPGPTGSNGIGLWRLPTGIYKLNGVAGYARNNYSQDYVNSRYARSGSMIIVSQSPESAGTIYEMLCISGNNINPGWMYTSIADRFVKNTLTQTTGNDINVGMTQKAITDALDKKSPMTILYVNGQDFGVNKSGSQIYVYKESGLTNKYSGSELYTLASAHTDFVIHAINTDGTTEIYRAFYVGLPSANTDEAFDEDGNFYIVSRYTYGGRDIGLAIMGTDTEYISVYVS